MRKNRIIILLCAGVLMATAFSIGRNGVSNATRENLSLPTHDSERGRVVPDHVVYASLFHKIVRLREKTRELQSQGHINQKPYFILKREAGLNEGQSTALEAIALVCWQKVEHQDKKAKAIIEAFQARFPDARVPAEGAPPPPPELKTMWDERNAMILHARDQLRATFGEGEFARFDNYIKFYHGANTSAITTNPIGGSARPR